MASDDPSPVSDMVPVALGQILLEKYRVDRILGEGGMGYVVAATHLTLGTPVAIKLLRSEHAGRADFTARFLREARAAVAIQSEHVARVLDVGTLPGGAPYMVLELLKGVDLGEELARRRRIPHEDAVEYVLQACEALAEAHGLGLVHRDLKPSNLFLTRRADGTPMIKLLDFGIAKAVELPGSTPSLTSTDSTIGSPMYMAPEQIRDARTVDARADVWSLGIVLHELITGDSPFDGETSGALFAAIAADEPKRLRAGAPEAPVEIEQAILRCLEKDPRRRTPTVGALADDLASVASPRSRVSIERVKGTLAKNQTTGDQAVPVAARTALASLGEATTESGPAALAQPKDTRRVGVIAGALAAGLLAAIAVVATLKRTPVELAPATASSAGVGDRVPATAPTTSDPGTGLGVPASAAPAASVTLTPVTSASERVVSPPPLVSTRVPAAASAKRTGGSPHTKTGNGLIDSRR